MIILVCSDMHSFVAPGLFADRGLAEDYLVSPDYGHVINKCMMQTVNDLFLISWEVKYLPFRVILLQVDQLPPNCMFLV